MRVLVNYDSKEASYLPILQYHLRNKNIQAIASSSSLSLGELIAKAQMASCEAIFCCNESTLANLVTGEKPTLDDYRGSVLRFSVPCVIGNSLKHTISISYGNWLLCKDLDRLFSAKEPPSPFNFVILETWADQQNAIKFLSESVLISYDIETKTILEDEENCQAGETIITCCAWSGLHLDGSIMTFVLPLVDFLETHWPNDVQYSNAISTMRSINALPNPKVMHNGMYDAFHSIIYRAEPINWTLDTMAMAWCEFSSLPKSLDFVASITLNDYIQWKAEAAAAGKSKDIQRYWAYNAKDAFVTLRIAMHYLHKLPAYAKKNYSIQFKFVYPFLYCGFEGVLIDQEQRKKLRDAANKKLQEALISLRITLNDANFNPGSPKQVKHYIYDVLGAADPKIGTMIVAGKKVKAEKGGNEKNLTAIAEQHPILDRVVSKILSYREASKAISTYFDFMQKNSRLLYSINPFGTETGRASASSSALWCGTQIQNIPPYAKEMLIADEGYTLIEIDNKQSEGFCTAFISGDKTMIATLSNRERDFYTTLGTLFFGIPYEQVTKPFRNKVLKRINHGASYRMGAATFVSNVDKKDLLLGAETLGIKITMDKKTKEGEMTFKDFAGMCLEKFHAPFPRVREWYEDVKLRIISTNRLVSPLGWTRYFFLERDGKLSYTAQTEAIAHEPQNLSVNILNIGLWNVWELVKKEEGKLRLKAQIHDSIFAQYIDTRPDLADKMNTCMQNMVVVNGRELLIPTDVKTSKIWKEPEE